MIKFLKQAIDVQGQVESWIDFTTQEVDAPMLSWFLPIIGYMEYNKKVMHYSAEHSSSEWATND